MAGRRAFGTFEHLAGAASAAVVLTFTEEIANAATEATTWLLALFGGSSTLGFIHFERHGSLLAVGAGVVVLGLVVAGADALVRRGRVPVWLPPLAVFALAMSALTVTLNGPEIGMWSATVMGAGLAAVIAASFTAWWLVAICVSRLRRA
jgi:hypothetical protein